MSDNPAPALAEVEHLLQVGLAFDHDRLVRLELQMVLCKTLDGQCIGAHQPSSTTSVAALGEHTRKLLDGVLGKGYTDVLATIEAIGEENNVLLAAQQQHDAQRSKGLDAMANLKGEAEAAIAKQEERHAAEREKWQAAVEALNADNAKLRQALVALGGTPGEPPALPVAQPVK